MAGYVRAASRRRRSRSAASILVLAQFAPAREADSSRSRARDADPGMRACAIDSLTAIDDYDARRCDAVPRRQGSARARGDGDRDRAQQRARRAARGRRRPCARRPWLAASSHRGSRELPFADGHVLAYLALAAGSVGQPDARSLAQALCERIDEVDGALRDHVRPGPARARVRRRRAAVREALRRDPRHARARSKQFWVFDVNAHEVLAKWNLPRIARRTLRTLVAELKAASDPEAVMHARFHAPSL